MTDIDLWGGGPEGQERLLVSVADAAIAKVRERRSPGKHLRRFRLSPTRAGRTMLEAKLAAGEVWASTQVLVHYRTKLAFQKLWDKYKYERIEAGCAPYINQCAIRVSAALKRAGMPLHGYSDPVCKAKGVIHARGARSLAQYLWRKFGRPEIIKANKKQAVLGRKGIVFFNNMHIDVWDGKKTGSGEYFGSVKEIWFWELE